MGWAGIGRWTENAAIPEYHWPEEWTAPRSRSATRADRKVLFDSADEVTVDGIRSEEPVVWRGSIAMNTERSCGGR